MPEPDFDVAVIGFGPVGALLSNLLGRHGLAVVVLERDARIHPLPRAVHFDGEVMRVFQAAGLAEAVAGVARATTKGMHFVNAAGRTLMVRRGTDGPGPHGWAANWYFHQPELDAALRRGVERFANVVVRLGHEAVALHDAGGHVSITARDVATGGSSELTARYAVGCDGARSLVREVIGAEVRDLGLHQPWLVVDVVANPGSERAKRLPDYTVQHCDPRRPMTRVHVKGARHRWEIMLMRGDEEADIVRPARFWPMLAHAIGPGDARIERAAVYTFHSLVASPWRRGRMFLAGDSAHQTPPFLGQGMCAGIRDASNLAWKLRMVLDGAAGDPLLDTYEAERSPHVSEFIELAVRLGAIIQTTDPEAAAARDAGFRAGGPALFDFPQPRLGPGAWLDGSPACGVVFPQPRLAGGCRLDDAVGDRFALLSAVPLGGAVPCARGGSRGRLDLAVIDRPGAEVERWLAERDAAAVILRPDRYVFAVARDRAGIRDAVEGLAACLGRPRAGARAGAGAGAGIEGGAGTGGGAGTETGGEPDRG